MVERKLLLLFFNLNCSIIFFVFVYKHAKNTHMVNTKNTEYFSLVNMNSLVVNTKSGLRKNAALLQFCVISYAGKHVGIAFLSQMWH